MNTLTCAELLAYPGGTFTERLEAHHRETGADAPTPAAPAVAPFAPTTKPARAPHGALRLSRRIDLGRFSGKDRVERTANYLRAHVPRVETWGEDALREMAERVLMTAEIVD